MFQLAPSQSRGGWLLVAVCILLVAVLANACRSAPAGSTSAPADSAIDTTAAKIASPTTAELSAPAGATSVTGEITVFAAASLTDAFKEIGAEFEKANPGAKVTCQFAGSPTLRTQLQQGANADVFASADEPNMQNAQQEGAISGEPRVFARNKLVIITPAQSGVGVVNPRDLAKPGLKLVIGQKDLPAGGYARQVFAKLSQDSTFGSDFGAKALANVVSEEANVKQIVSKVQLGEADAGIVYSTDVTPAVRSQVKIVEIPAAYNVIANYPVALVTGGANTDGATKFIDYLLSPAGQDTLERNGFLPVGAD